MWKRETLGSQPGALSSGHWVGRNWIDKEWQRKMHLFYLNTAAGSNFKRLLAFKIRCYWWPMATGSLKTKYFEHQNNLNRLQIEETAGRWMSLGDKWDEFNCITNALVENKTFSEQLSRKKVSFIFYITSSSSSSSSPSSSFIFKNVAFFHAKLGSDVCPSVDNQTSGDTLQGLTRPLVEKSPSASYPPWVLERVFGDGMPFHAIFIYMSIYGNLFHWGTHHISSVLVSNEAIIVITIYFWKRPFLPRSARVICLPWYGIPPNIPEYCPSRLQTKQFCVILHTFAQILPVLYSTS